MIKTKLFVTLLIGGCLATSVQAQTDIQNEYELNPVVVTGTGTNQRLKNTPTPVTVITANEIKKTGITDFQQAMTMMVPSLSFSTNSMGSYLMMNGLSNKYVLILINGRKLTGDTSRNIDLSQIDMSRVRRIEVLNGAASSLYGSDAMAGVINIITFDPQDVVQFSSNSRYSGKGQYTQSLNLDIAKNKFGSFTSYKHDQADNWQNNSMTVGSDEALVETLEPLSIGFHSNIVNQKFTYDATDRLSFYAEGGYYWKLTDRPVKREGMDGGYTYDLNYESFKWGTGAKYKLNDLSSIQFDYMGNDYDSRYKYIQETSEYLPGEYALTKNQKFHDAELKGIFGFTSNSTTVFGVDYRKETLDRPSANIDKGVYTLSGYGQHEVKLWDRFTGIVGLRYDHHEEAGGRLTPKVAAMYSLGNVNMRASYSAGYRAPGLDELYYNMYKTGHGSSGKQTITLGDPDLKPERSNFFSVNAEYNTSRFSTSVTGYLNYLDDMISSVTVNIDDLPDPNGFREWAQHEFSLDAADAAKLKNFKQYTNFERAIVRGFEINMAANIVSGLTVNGNYSLAYARGKNAEEWQDIERSIRHTGTVSGNYAHTWKAYTMNLNLTGRMQSKRLHPGDTDGDAPGYGIWNLNTRHTFDYFRHFLFEPGIGIDNIFDKKDNRPIGVNYSLLSPGRLVYISLVLKFKK